MKDHVLIWPWRARAGEILPDDNVLAADDTFENRSRPGDTVKLRVSSGSQSFDRSTHMYTFAWKEDTFNVNSVFY